ncbi:MAG TPA: hypothetical protein H9693_04455 [Firmicutes bacterium]|nr:hypothetical protein [Bacillota bacterium]
MNKYQKYLLLRDKSSFLFESCAPKGEICNGDTYGSYEADSSCFLIKQDPDITKTIYELSVSKNSYPFIKSVHTKKNGVYTEVPLLKSHKNTSRSLPSESNIDEKFLIITDFDDRIDSIKLQFIKNIADDLEIEFVYREADKQAYALRQEALKKENMLKRACIKHSVGDNLVNIYFQPCSDDYDHTDIFLYIPEKTEETTTGGRYGPVKKENILSWVLIMKAGAEKGMFFKSITGLAYGRYAFIAKQFDKNNNLLVETDYIEFRIEKQYYFFGDQGNICVI